MRKSRINIRFALMILIGAGLGAQFIKERQQKSEPVSPPVSAVMRPAELVRDADAKPAQETLVSELDSEKRKLMATLAPQQQAELTALVQIMELMARKAAQPDGGPHSDEHATATDRPKRFPVSVQGIREAVQRSRGVLKACYEPWLALNPQMSGRISPAFTIRVPENADSTHAKIDEVKIAEGGLGNVFLEGCIRSVFMDLLFELPPAGPIVVRYPLHFEMRPATNEEVTAPL